MKLRKGVARKVRGHWHLFWAPKTLAWAVLDDLGAQLLDALCRDVPWDELCALLSRHGLPRAEASQELEQFVTNLKCAGFFQGEEEAEERANSTVGANGPHVLYLHLTERCNLACSYCYFFAQEREVAGKDLPLALARQALEEARALGFSHLVCTGGEPLLHPRIFPILEAARKQGFFVELLTNGQTITGEIARELSRCCHRVTVSLDSPDPRIHDKHRGKGSHARAVQAVQTLKEAGVQEVAVAAVITRDNQDETFADFQAFAESLGANKVSRQVYMAQGNMQDEFLKPDLSRLSAQLEAELEVWVQKGAYKGEEKLIWRDHCGAGLGVLAMGADGNVYPCQALVRAEFVLGNLRCRSLADIYHRASLLRQLRAIRVDGLEPCKGCAYRHLCGGGCRALAYNLTRSLSAPIPADYCALNRVIYEGVLWRVALGALTSAAPAEP